MTIIYHICSIESCINIIESGCYKSAYPDPMAADSGINCFVEGKASSLNQSFQGQGAKIIMKWRGAIVVSSSHGLKLPLVQDTLYDSSPWRAVIPRGTLKSNIEVIKIEVDITKITLGLMYKLWRIRKKLCRGAINIELK